MEALQRTRLLSVGVLAVVLCTGVVLGMALDVRLSGASDDGEVAEQGEEARSERRSRRRAPMYRQVGELTEAQDARIDSIIDMHRDSMRDLQREFSESYDPRYWSIIENTRESIREVLTPEQVERYDSLLAEYDRRGERKDEGSNGRDGRRR